MRLSMAMAAKMYKLNLLFEYAADNGADIAVIIHENGSVSLMRRS